MLDDEWWRGAVIYQVYPRSFQDTTNNGIGDLPGITQRLDYIASLGVDALWISPFFKSPMADYGYDVEDYREVDPMFGTLGDFDNLLARAHELGLKLLVDLVPCHTSDQHAWFKEARQSCDNPKADWYVFAQAKDDGTPPNNWLSIFGGVAWTWEPRRGQYYLHNFLESQPQLNWHNPEVKDAILAEAEFWLKRGVDGFRVDAIDFALHDQALRDNPVRPREQAITGGMADGSPYARQVHIYQKGHPDLPDKVLRPLRDLAARYDKAFLLGEMSGDRSAERLAAYTDGGGLDAAYTFELLKANRTPDGFKHVVDHIERHIGHGWPCYSLGNHDVPRHGTDLADIQYLFTAILCCLRGTICLYQGEELGLTEADLPFDDLQDPYGIAFYPAFKGRDGCRTPMPWMSDVLHAGFSSAKPWLPIPEEHRQCAVDLQEPDLTSTLHRTRTFLTWRKAQPALLFGNLRFLDVPEPIMAIQRVFNDQQIFCFFNISHDVQSLCLPSSLMPMEGHGFQGEINDICITLPPYDAFFGRTSM